MALSQDGKNLWYQGIGSRHRAFVYRSLLESGHINDASQAGNESVFLQNLITDDDQLEAQVIYVRGQANSHLIPDDQLEWITEDYRLLRWVDHTFLKVNSKIDEVPWGGSYTSIYPEFSIKNRFCERLDNWNTELNAKSSEVQKIRTFWSEVKSKDKRFEWLDSTNISQCKWAWGYLQDRKNELWGKATIEGAPVEEKDYYPCVLSVFDLWLGHLAEEKVFMDKMKRAWSQKKYRDSLDDKVICNIVLKTETKNKLKELAEKSELKMNEKLERMINAEYRKLISGLS